MENVIELMLLLKERCNCCYNNKYVVNTRFILMYFMRTELGAKLFMLSFFVIVGLVEQTIRQNKLEKSGVFVAVRVSVRTLLVEKFSVFVEWN